MYGIAAKKPSMAVEGGSQFTRLGRNLKKIELDFHYTSDCGVNP